MTDNNKTMSQVSTGAVLSNSLKGKTTHAFALIMKQLVLSFFFNNSA